MSKRDGEFAKTKTDWHRDPRCRALKHPSYKWLNQVLWNLCVKERRETLPSYYTAATLAHEADIDVRTVRKGLALMQQERIGLITVNEDQTITVHGVRDIHENKKFRFLDDELKPCPPRERVEKEREKEKSRVIDEAITNPPTDPFFQQPSSQDPGDIQEIFEAAKKYKNTTLSHKIRATVINLLGSLNKDTIIKAIENQTEVFELSRTDHRYRPKFENHFMGEDAVKEMANTPPVAPVSFPDNSEKDTEKLLDGWD